MTHPTLDDKLYDLGNGRKLSMRDLLDYFAQMGRLRVSDLHIKAGVPPVYRVDGQLQKMKGPPLTRESVELLARSLLTEHEWPRLVEGRSTDGSCMTDTMQFRLNFFHENEGLAIAIRALESSAPAVEEIGFPNNVWRDIVARQHGLVLVTGITGAGKSTTIASLIDRIAQTRPCRIITLEDPIEYRLHSKAAIISQREVGRDVPSFERGLRDCLREDPDVIFVGEMTDQESTTWTLTAAETGHLVFSGLHTRDTASTINRILDLYPAIRAGEVANQFSMALRYIISQKLVPRSGERGRVVAMEILNNTYAVANLIRQVKPEQIATLIQTQTRDVSEQRMSTLEHSLAVLVRQGRVTRDDALKAANHPQLLMDEMQRDEDTRS